MLSNEPAFAALIEQIADGAIAISRNRQVLLANREAVALLHSQKLIKQSSSGGLGFVCREAEAAFTSALEGCVGTIDHQLPTSFIVRSGNRSTHPVHVVPLKSSEASRQTAPSGPLALILIESDRKHSFPSEITLRTSYRLSNREAAVVLSVASGATLKETAFSLGVTMATVRNQLGAAMRKLRVRRRAQLVAVLAGMISKINLKIVS
jgi:DNA-binding CsgD family transcriptional regulator